MLIVPLQRQCGMQKMIFDRAIAAACGITILVVDQPHAGRVYCT